MNLEISKTSIKRVENLMRDTGLKYKLIIEKDEKNNYDVYFRAKTKNSHLFKDGLETFYFSLCLNFANGKYQLESPIYKQSIKKYLLDIKNKVV